MKIANNINIVPHIDGINFDNTSQGRLSNISSANKKPSLTERMNKGTLKYLNFLNYFDREE